jgi:hypothetical protein
MVVNVCFVGFKGVIVEGLVQVLYCFFELLIFEKGQSSLVKDTRIDGLGA